MNYSIFRQGGVKLAAILALLGTSSHAQDRTSPPVIVAAAAEESISDCLEALGTLAADEAVVLSAKTTGIISAIHFSDGMTVPVGKVLVELQNAEEQGALAEARARLEEARLQLTRAQSSSLSASVIDERQRNYRAAEAQLVVAQARLQDRLIVAPFGGVLGLKRVSVGALVQPGDPTWLLMPSRR